MQQSLTAVEDAAKAYRRDGAAVVRGVLSTDWIERMRRAITRVIGRESSLSNNYADAGGSFFADIFMWRSDPDFRAFMFESPLPKLAADFMESTRVQIFYDQLLVKEPGTPTRTPWHQDLPYWPATGEQIISIWVPFDRVSPENGVVTYVRASHRSGQIYRPRPFTNAADVTGDEARTDRYLNEELPMLPDIDANPNEHEYVTWTMDPGDVILHHPLAIHGAPGNATQDQRRRALATRWLGDDARWLNRNGHILKKATLASMNPPQFENGDRFTGDWFPSVWPAS